LIHIHRQALGIDKESARRALELPSASENPIFLGGLYASSGKYAHMGTSKPQVVLEEQAHVREVNRRDGAAAALSPSAAADVGLSSRPFAERLPSSKAAAPTPPPTPLPTGAAATVAGGSGAAATIAGASGSGAAATVAGPPPPATVAGAPAPWWLTTAATVGGRGGKKDIQVKGQSTLPRSWQKGNVTSTPASSATTSPVTKKNRL
jgi:hypothetical protein